MPKAILDEFLHVTENGVNSKRGVKINCIIYHAWIDRNGEIEYISIWLISLKKIKVIQKINISKENEYN